jgi:PAS domain S-box-containing protein
MSDPKEERNTWLIASRLAAIIDSCDDAIIGMALDGTITSWNRAAHTIFGYSEQEAVGQNVSILLPPDRQDEEPRIMARLSNGERIEHYESVRRRKDGQLVDVSLTVSAIRDPQGAIVGASKISRDITAQKRAEEELRTSEAWYRVTLSSIGDAVIATDARGRVTFMNTRAEELTGWAQSEAVGKLLPETFDIVNEVTRKKVENPVDKVLEHGGVVGLANHTVLRHRRGLEFAIDDSAAPIRNTLQQLMGVVLVFHDVTEARKAELAQRSLAAIVESSDDAIISKSLDGIITSWNKSAERIFGYTAEEAIGKHITLIIPPERHNEEPQILARLRRGERVDHYETIRMTRDGRRLNISVTISPIRDSEGHIVGASKIARDVTGQKEAEAAVLEAQAQLQAYAATLETRVAERTLKLEDVNKSLEGLSYSIAHDLRSPLRAIQGLTEILVEDSGSKLDENGKRIAADIVRSVRRMDNLINDLMSYGRLSHDDLPLAAVHTDEVVKQVLRHLQVDVEAVKAVVDVGAGLPVVRAHKTTFEQVMTNLISNALKFVDSSRPPKVAIYSAQASENGFTRIVVEDNGIGIAPEFRDRIYRIFERLHAGSRYPGTGIGLAIVQKGAERMGGRTGLESEPGKGSKFWIELPLANR